MKHDFLREGEYPSDPSASSGERVETVKKEEFQLSKTCQDGWALNKGILLVAIGNYATAAVAFLSNLIVGRHLGPTQFGVFATFLVLTPVIFEMTGHGLESALVRFATPEIARNKEKAFMLFKLVLNWKIILNLVFICIGFFLLEPAISWVGGSNQTLKIIQFAIIMGFAFSLLRYALAVLQSLQTYWRYLITLLFTNLLRLGLIILASLLLFLNIRQIMVIYIGSTFLGFLLGMIMIPDVALLWKTKIQNIKLYAKEIHQFSIWIIFSTLIFISVEPLNVFMIRYFHSNYSVGIFTAALLVAKSLDILAQSIKTVLLPKISLAQETIREYIKTCFKVSLPLALGVLPLFFLSSFLIKICYGDKFSGSIPVFNILFWGYWISLLLDPIWLIFYSKEKTHYLLWADVLMLLIVFGCNLFFIQYWGAIGAAYSVVIARVSGRCLLGIILFCLSRKGGSLRSSWGQRQGMRMTPDVAKGGGILPE